MLTSVNSARMEYRRQRTIKREGIAIGPMALKFVTIGVLALLTLVYLIQSTKGSSKNLQMTDFEQKKEALESQRQDLELEAVRLRTITKLKDTAKEFKLEPVGQQENMDDAE